MMPVCDGGHGGSFAIQPGENVTVYDAKDCSPGRIGPLSCALSADGLYLSGHGYYADDSTPKHFWNGKPVKASDPAGPLGLQCSQRDEDGAAGCWPK